MHITILLWYYDQVPRVNQETAEVGAEPTETLTKFRSSENLHPDKKPYGRVIVYDFQETFIKQIPYFLFLFLHIALVYASRVMKLILPTSAGVLWADFCLQWLGCSRKTKNG